LCAQFLGVSATALTAALSYKTALVGGDLCTVFLNIHGAQAQRDALARSLYHVLYYWLTDQLNRNIGDPEATNHIAILQMYGFSLPDGPGSFEQFAVNLANERLSGFVLHEVLGSDIGVSRLMHDDAVSLPHVPAWSTRLQPMHLLVGDYAGRRGGLVGALEMHAASGDPAQTSDDVALINYINRTHGQNACFVPGPPPPSSSSSAGAKKKPLFGIKHWMGESALEYSVDGFCQRNMDLEVSPDFYALLHGASHSRFVRELLSIDQIALDYHPGEESTIVGTFLSTRPSLRPTVRRPLAELKDTEDIDARATAAAAAAAVPHAVQPLQLPSELRALDESDPANTFVGELSSALDDVFAAASYCKVWHVLHIRAGHPTRPASLSSVGGLDRAFVQQQVHALGMADMSVRRTPTEYT
ncbi:hypothetical protein LPJ56_006370, partial [Coemansia sp. RSA 2599]